MAQKMIVELVDDLDGTAIADGEGGTVSFSLENRSFEIDLTAKNAAQLHEALAPFIDAARPVRGNVRKESTRTRREKNGRDLALVRAWARDNGHIVSDRGRVPGPVIEAYDAAH